MKNKKTTKKFAIALLALLGVVSTGATYAYWQGAVLGANQDVAEKINIGHASEIETAVNVSYLTDGKELVPSGRVENSATQTDLVAFDFSVTWTDEDAVLADAVANGSLSVTVTGKTIAGAAANIELVNVTLPSAQAIVLSGSAVDVHVEVTLTEPETKAVYDAIIDQEIIVALNFAVTVA